MKTNNEIIPITTNIKGLEKITDLPVSSERSIPRYILDEVELTEENLTNEETKKRIYDTGNFVDDILTFMSSFFYNKLDIGNNEYLTKNIGKKCFEAAGFEVIPKASEIKNVTWSAGYIYVTLKTGDRYDFKMTDNAIKFDKFVFDIQEFNMANAYFEGTNQYIHSFGNNIYGIKTPEITGITRTEEGYDIISNGLIYHYKIGKYIDYYGNESTGVVISSIDLKDVSFEFHSDLTEDDYSYFNEKFGEDFKEGIKINGYTTHTVATENGEKEYKFYWLGESKTLAQFLYASANVFNSLDSYPDNVKDYINNSDFNAFVFAGRDDVNPNLLTTDWAGFYNTDGRYISLSNASPYTVFHELGHHIDHTFGREADQVYFGTYFYSSNNSELKDLYEKYKKDIQQLYNVGYVQANGVPYSHEFFAELSNVYFTQREELKILLPECYEYIDNFYNGLSG